MTVKTMDIKRMFNLYPSNKAELQLKSNIVDVSHFVGYANAQEGSYDSKVITISSILYKNGILTYDLFTDYLRANNERLVSAFKRIAEVFSIEINKEIPSHNKKVYKMIKELIKTIYDKKVSA